MFRRSGAAAANTAVSAMTSASDTVAASRGVAHRRKRLCDRLELAEPLLGSLDSANDLVGVGRQHHREAAAPVRMLHRNAAPCDALLQPPTSSRNPATSAADQFEASSASAGDLDASERPARLQHLAVGGAGVSPVLPIGEFTARAVSVQMIAQSCEPVQSAGIRTLLRGLLEKQSV